MTADFERVVFIPVIHTDADSVKRVRTIIRERRPEVVAVELDKQRFELMQNQSLVTDLQEPRPTGDMVHDLLQQFAILEKNLGAIVGSHAGAEMMAAVEEGRAVNAKIALIDRPLNVTAQALMQVPLDEIYRLAGLIPRISEDIEVPEATEMIELLKDENGVANVMDEFQKEFPNISRALIDERDRYIARALKTILEDVKGEIVAVLGAGHIDGVKRYLRDMLKHETAS